MLTEKAPLIAPEQGLLLHLYLFGAGIVLFHLLPAAWQGGDRLLGVVLGGAAVTLCCLGAVHYFDQRQSPAISAPSPAFGGYHRLCPKGAGSRCQRQRLCDRAAAA